MKIITGTAIAECLGITRRTVNWRVNRLEPSMGQMVGRSRIYTVEEAEKICFNDDERIRMKTFFCL